MRAFENYKHATIWAIFQGKDLLFKGEGADDLSALLSSMDEFGSDAVYRLKVYEDLDDPRKVKERTEADGSFSFRLGEEGAVVAGSRSNYVRSLEDRIKKMEEGDGDDDKSIGGKIGSALLGLIDQPNELVQLIGSLKGLFQPQQQPQPAYNPAYQMQPASIGRVAPDFTPVPFPQQNINQPEIIDDVAKKKNEKPQDENFVENVDDAQAERLAVAVNKLHKADKEIVTHLEKLADIAEKNPALFKVLLGSLDTMQ